MFSSINDLASKLGTDIVSLMDSTKSSMSDIKLNQLSFMADPHMKLNLKMLKNIYVKMLMYVHVIVSSHVYAHQT